MTYTIVMSIGGHTARGTIYQTEREVCEAIQAAAELARRNKFSVEYTYEETYDCTLYDDNTPATSPSDYKAIALWGKQMGSMYYYIRYQQELAFAACAPIDALYEQNGIWSRVSELGGNDPKKRQSEFRAQMAKL